VGANDFFLLGVFEDVHDRAVAGGPVGFGEAMHQEDVDLFDAEFAAEAVDVGAHFVGIARPGFGKDGDLGAVELLERGGDVGMAAVGVGGVEEAEAVFVVAVE